MRMRRKKWARPELAECNYFIDNPEDIKGRWKDQFKNKSNPLYVELGCGKGVFTAEIALKNKNANFLAIDIKSDVLAVARRNIEALFKENNETPDNIILTAFNISRIELMMSPEDTVDRLYINFCNPWPKKKHKKRRLTYPDLLVKYKDFLKKGGEIHFKTDDDELFEESLDYFKENGFEIIDISYDLHNSDIENNILTEHEIRFAAEGIKIKYCVAKFM